MVTDTYKIEEVIARLAQMPRQGKAYDHMGRHGWSNPIRQDTGPLLQALVLARNPKRILEIGTAHGESLLNMALAAPKAEFHTIEWLEQLANEAGQNFLEAGVDAFVHNGDAMKVLETLTGQFDFIFLDGNKDGYFEQFNKMMELDLLNPDNATIVADNVIDRQKECAQFLAIMQQFPHLILQTECGLLVAQV